MELIALRDKILNKDIPNLIIFEGTESNIVDIYIEQIKKSIGKDYLRLNKVSDYFNLIHTKSLFKQNTDFVIIKNDEDFLKDDSMWNILDNVKQILVLHYSNLDKYKSFSNRFANSIYKVALTEKDIKTSLMLRAKNAGMNISEKYISWLMNNCQSDYGRCINELDKVLIFKNDIRTADEIFKQFAKDNAFHYDVPDCVFDFAEAFLDRNKSNVYKLYEDLKENGEQPMVILTVLYNNFRNLLLVQGARNPTPENTDLKEFLLRKLKYKVGKYSTKELTDIILLLTELNKEVKLGQIDDRTAVEYFITKAL